MVDEHRSARFAAALTALRARIDGVERAWTHRVEVLPVTKGFDDEAIEIAARNGCRAIGENYAQEILAKRTAIERCDVTVHFIGRLQSNKIRQLTDVVTIWSSIDRTSVIDELAKRAPGARIRIQVNTTGELQKGGCPPESVETLVARAMDRGLAVEGLMTVGPTGAPPEAARPGFRLLRTMVDGCGLSVCSMGMTADLEVAVAEGSTEVRVGTALFGPRPARPSTPENPS